MTYDEFSALPEEQQRTLFITSESYDELEAERNSLRTENEELRKENMDIKESERKTKEVNYTLSRKLNIAGEHKRAEDVLHDIFK